MGVSLTSKETIVSNKFQSSPSRRAEETEKIVAWHCPACISPDKPAEHLSGSPICHAILVYGRWECERPIRVFPSVIHAMCPVNLNVTTFQGGDPLGKDYLWGNQPRRSPPPPLATPPASRYSSCSYPQYPSSSRWVSPADFLSLWLSSYPHVQLLERNRPSQVSASSCYLAPQAPLSAI